MAHVSGNKSENLYISLYVIVILLSANIIFLPITICLLVIVCSYLTWNLWFCEVFK